MHIIFSMTSMRGSRKCRQRGSHTTLIFFVWFCVLVDERGDYPITSQSGPPSARQRNAIKWRFDGGLILAQHYLMAW